MIGSVFQKIKIRFKLLRNYLIFKYRTRNNVFEKRNPFVFFDLVDINQEPYYFPIIFSFHEAGYNIILADNIKFIGHSFGSGRYIYQLEHLLIRKRPVTGTEIFITDSKTAYKKVKNFSKKIWLNANAFDVNNNKIQYLPYPMHPNAYHSGYYKKVDVLRDTERKCRVLFSGNTDSTAYKNPIIRKKFAKLNRIEVIEALLSNLTSERKIVIQDQEDKMKLMQDYFNGAVFFLWQWSPVKSNGLEIRVPNDEWHNFLATSDFFLCCPGIVIPQSHNAIEAMSVGTIPILQYAEYFHPMLEDGINCITFSNEIELIQKVTALFLMKKEDIIQLRKNVIKYYDRYLRHDIVSKMLINMPAGENMVFYYNEATA